MKNTHPFWYVVLGLFYVGLGLWFYSFYLEANEIRAFNVVPGLESSFEGNDWVEWEDTDKGVIAKKVHPLPKYREIDRKRIEPGDRIISVESQKIYKADQIDKITRARRPGNIFFVEYEKYDPFNRIYTEEASTFLQNGYRLSFSFNQLHWYWNLSTWILGLGAFIALVIFIILAPIVRGQILRQMPLLALVSLGLLFFLVQFGHNLYLIIYNDLKNLSAEKAFILLYLGLLAFYSISFLFLKAKLGRVTGVLIIPSLLGAVYLGMQVYQVIYVEELYRFFHTSIENYAYTYFLLHILGGTLLYLISKRSTRGIREKIYLILISFIALLGIAYFFLEGNTVNELREHVIFGTFILMLYPLIHSPIEQLQFGKVSLVITQTLQYLVFFILGLILYLLLSQLFSYSVLASYRQILLPVTFLILLAVIRVIFLANEDRLSRYFVSSQQEKLNRIKAFIARISQYTSSEKLLMDLRKELKDFFQTDQVDIWWSPSEQEREELKAADVEEGRDWDRVYHTLRQSNGIWSQTKVISPVIMENEEELLETPYHLISPVSIEEGNYALLQLGKKKRGVYNLSDLELISQIVQQTQLTMSVLELVKREKDLMQQTYEANLTALRSQINPHFLFNTLNSIGELVHESADRAEAAVEKLAFIFRYTLDKSSENFVPLEQEVSLIQTYLDMEKIRFGERLDVDIQIRDGMNSVPIPSFILLTLVENCIKHGVSKILHNGWVSVIAYKKEEFLVCEVEDNGPGIDTSRIYKSHGLSNSISRIENIYEMKDLFEFINTGNGTRVVLRIPLEKAYEKAKS
ncbi:MAG: histidine kinase [Bacteroidota bacterium]